MTLEEIRTQIDQMDSSIKELFIARMGLSEQVARVKAKTQDSIFKPEREAVIIEKQSADLPPHLVMEYQAFIRRFMQISRKYQYGLTLKMRDCFPYTFTTALPDCRQVTMVGKELCFYPFGAKDEVKCVSDYQTMAEQIESGLSDAGAGVIEHIGQGVNDELNTLLYTHKYYINRCTVVSEENGDRHKVVMFGPQLCAAPEHNRLKLVVIARNETGSLGSLLSMIADYGINVTEIHSIPFRTGDSWNYRFFLELGANLLDETVQALLYQLTEETQDLQILGSYLCDGDFPE